MIRNIFKYICGLLIINMFIFTNSISIYAADEFIMKDYIPENIHYTIDGGIININADINDEGNYEIDSQINTKDLEVGYYTAFIYENAKKDWSSFEGIAFDFENLGKDYIDLNIDIITKNQEDFKIPNNKIVYVKSNLNKLTQQMKAVNGVLKINEKFNGTIIIPFENLKSKNNNKLLDPSEILLWGIDITLSDNSVRQFIVSSFSLVNFNNSFKQYMNSNFMIKGDSEAIIPKEGEFTYLYKVLKNPSESDLNRNDIYSNSKNNYEDASFSIYEDAEGVSITKDGVLAVNNKAQPGSITIVSSIDENKFKQGFNVNLVNSNEVKIVTDDGVSIDIPKVEELSNIIKFNNVFMSNKYINIFRSIIITGFLIFFTLIIVWMKSRRGNN